MNFLEIAEAMERRKGAWCYLETDETEHEWTCGSTLPDRAADAIRQQAKYLELAQRAIDDERARVDGFITALTRIERNSNEPWAREFAGIAISADKVTSAVNEYEGPRAELKRLREENARLRDRIQRIAEDAFAFRGRPFRYADIDADPDMVWRELQAVREEISAP